MGQLTFSVTWSLCSRKCSPEEIDPSFLITHRLKLDDAPEAYKTFRDKKDGCIKVVMTPERPHPNEIPRAGSPEAQNRAIIEVERHPVLSQYLFGGGSIP